MKIAYVAGPYRAKTNYEMLMNIRRASDLAAELWKLGYGVICPHNNTAWFSGITDEMQFLIAGEELVRRSDLVVGVEGWEKSIGSIREKDAAEFEGIPFYSSLNELVNALEEGKESI